MRAGIALGSNLGDRLAHLQAAWREVQALPGVREAFHFSRLYETAPVGMAPEAGPVLNGVVEVDFTRHPAELLEGLLGVEAALGRPSRHPRNAPRTIDLDLLYAGNLVLTTSEVVIPHPRLHLREFVLRPLHDIAPALRLPGQERTVAELLAALDGVVDGVELRADLSLV